MDKKIRILLLIDEATIGGGQKHLLLLAHYLDKTKFDVSVACEPHGFLVDELNKLNISVHPINITNKPSLSALANINRIIREIKPDIIHSHGGTAGFYSRLSRLFRNNIKIVHTYHGIHYLNWKLSAKRVLFKSIDRVLLNLTDNIICVAQNDYELGLLNGVVKKNKSVVIRNGIEVSNFVNSIKDSFTDSLEEPTIGCIGRLHHQKGFEFLIRAANSIIENTPKVKFVIVGDGELFNPLKLLCKELKVEGHFNFMGNQNDIPSVMKKFDIFVLPSLWEGLPLVLLEAMAAKKAIVATQVNGTTEILENEISGLLVPPGNHELLGSAIVRLLNEPQLRKSLIEKAYKKVVSAFDVSIMIEKTSRLYEEITRESAC